MLDEARRTWPDLAVDEPAFVSWLQARLGQRTGDELTRLCTRDLYLAYACLAGDTRALAMFDQEVMPAARNALARMGMSDAVQHDLLQTLRLRVLVGDRAPARIHEYAGRGDLRSWVRVIATRLALDLRRARRREELVPEQAIDALGLSRDPEIEHLRARHAHAFAEAFAQAAATLSPEERNVLRFHYVERLSIDAIGEILAIHRVTAARRINAARDRLVEATKARFAERIGATPSQLSSELRALGSAAEISIARALKQDQS